MADFAELLQTRRSIRDYQDRTVSKDLIRQVIKDSCLAPNAGNRQPWRFVVIHHRGIIQEISEHCKANHVREIEDNPISPLKQYEAALRSKTFNIFYNAPCLVYILGNIAVHSLYVDCALAASYFMFSAADRGLGTCWIGLGARIVDELLRERIGIGTQERIVAPIIAGYPKRIPSPPSRREADIIEIQDGS